MKIVSGAQAKQIDQYTIDHEPIASIDLMERAGSRLVEKVNHIFTGPNSYFIFAGPGNNGGDGLVMARLLHEQGNLVQVYLLKIHDFSPELTENISRADSIGVQIKIIESEHEIEKFQIGN